MFVQVDVLI